MAGVGGPRNDWAIPTRAFDIQNIINKQLVLLRRCPCGDNLIPEQNCSEPQCKQQMLPTECSCLRIPFRLCKNKCPQCNGQTEVTMSKAPVNALIDKGGKERTIGTLRDASLADSEGIANVTFGENQCHEEFQEIPLMPLDDIGTPPTPRPCVTP